MTQIDIALAGAVAKPSARSTGSTDPVNILVLGAGWTSTFLLPLLEECNITHAATTRSGHDNTIAFTFAPDSQDSGPYKLLPPPKTILITFPLKGQGQSSLICRLYRETHDEAGASCRWVQLGSTGIFTEKG